MVFLLEFFDEFVGKECRKFKKLPPSAIISDFAKKMNLIQFEANRLRKNLRVQVFAIEKERRIELFIQHHQAHIIRLANRVAREIGENQEFDLGSISSARTKLNLYKTLLYTFEELLTYIETHFSRYFDLDQTIPDTYVWISAKEFKEKRLVLKSLLESEKVDDNLVEIILYPISQFISVPDKLVPVPSKEEVTFRRLIYLKCLVRDLLNLGVPNDGSFAEAIYEHLFYLNFNSYHFVKYETTRIRNHIIELTSLSDQLEYLSYTLKKLCQRQIKPSFILKPDRESLRELLSNWLEQEIHFMEKKRQHGLMISPGRDHDDGVASFKVRTTLSVSQLAYWIRLLKDSGIITNENKAELIRFFSKHFSSTQNENISPESFRSKYFGSESSAVVAVQGMLNKLIMHSKKEK